MPLDPGWFSLLTPAQQVILQYAILAVVVAGMAVNYFRKPGPPPTQASADVVLPSLSVTDMRPWRETAETSAHILEESRRQTGVLIEIRDTLEKMSTAEEVERRAIALAATISQRAAR